MDINWLQDFLAVAETRHFTQAANRRNISQAAFSRRIRALETWLGVTLIKRGTVPAQLTAEGKLFENEARETVSRLLDARASLTEFAGDTRSSVRISACHSVAAARMSDWWASWCGGSSINLDAHISDIADITSTFVSGFSDVLICHHSNLLPIPVDTRHFLSHVIEKDRLVPVVSISNHKQLENGVNETLKRMPLLTYSKNGYFYRVMKKVFQQSAVHLLGEHVVETEMAGFVANCAERNLGVGWIPESLLNASYGEVLMAIEQPELTAEMDLVAYVSRKKRSQACDHIWQRITA